jgi:hypothetical protein
MSEGINEDSFIPIYYTVPRSLTELQVQHVLNVLKFTPIIAAFITNIDDAELANLLSDLVLQFPTQWEAREAARTYGEATVIISGEPTFHAHFSDGHTEIINFTDQSGGQTQVH